jgi:Zn-dependent metalloprotease
MAPQVCHIVPPYLLQGIASGQNVEASHHAQQTLASINHIHRSRKDHFQAKLAHGGSHSALTRHDIVPDYVLEDITNAPGIDDSTRQHAADTLASNRHVRQQRAAGIKATLTEATLVTTSIPFMRSVYDMESQVKTTQDKDKEVDITYTLLPGKLIRTEGQKAATDKAVNDVYDNALKVLDFFRTVFKYDSLDGKNMPVVSSVHYKKFYMNASWLGVDTDTTPPKPYNQMVYGDGFAQLLSNFTNSLDVIGHEMTVSDHHPPGKTKTRANELTDRVSTPSHNSTAASSTTASPGL